MVIAAAAAALRPTTSWLSYLSRHRTTMSFARPYGYIQDSELAKLWKQRDKSTNSIAVVDVRDDDFEGGNIPGCIHIPSSDFLDRVNELVKSPLKDVQQVVFHCSLSQARGPKAARMYKEAREAAIASGSLKKPEGQDQTVSVLRDGFAGFGSKYKNDAALVEKYDAESWKYR